MSSKNCHSIQEQDILDSYNNKIDGNSLSNNNNNKEKQINQILLLNDNNLNSKKTTFSTCCKLPAGNIHNNNNNNNKSNLPNRNNSTLGIIRTKVKDERRKTIQEQENVRFSGLILNSSNLIPNCKSQNDNSETKTFTYKLSKRRWAILFGVCLFGFLNGLTNELFAILHTLVKLMEISLDDYVYMSQVFFYIIPICGLPIAWFVDYFGFKKSIYLAVFLSIIRNSFRALLFWQDFNLLKWKFFFWFSYNILLQLIVLIYYCLPLKISEIWFSSKERPIAWSLMIVSPIFGSACSSLTVPRYASKSIKPLAYVNLISALISLIIILICITKSKPKYPPTKRSLMNSNFKNNNNNNNNNNDKNQQSSLIKNLNNLIRNKNVLIHVISIASFDTFVVTINSVLQDVLSAGGFNQIQTGQFLATMAIASVILQTFSSFFITPNNDDDDDNHVIKDKQEIKKDKNDYQDDQDDLIKIKKKNVKKCKLYMLTNCLTFLLYSCALLLRDFPQQQWWLAIIASLIYTLLRFWAIPNYNDLLAYLISGLISQPTVGAFQMIAQALFSVLFSVLFVYLRKVDYPINNNNNSLLLSNETTTSPENIIFDDQGYEIEDILIDGDGRPNYFWSITFLASVAIFVTTIYLTFFDGLKKDNKLTNNKEINYNKKSISSSLSNREKCFRAASLPLDLSVVGSIGGHRHNQTQR